VARVARHRHEGTDAQGLRRRDFDDLRVLPAAARQADEQEQQQLK
jgi:hypothetical protein